MPERVVVVGGGVGGLAAALALARDGHPVEVVERDPLPPTATADEAFAAERRGAPQVHQTHGFLARIVVVLRERFPDVLDQLRAAGGFTLPVTANLGEARPGDEDLAVLIVRRTTFEWTLRAAAVAEANVRIRTGAAVTGLIGRPPTEEGPAIVEGVHLDDGSTLEADTVVVASGRRSSLPRWLAALGVAVPETVHESGLMYLTRWYRFDPSSSVDLDPKLGGDLGFVKYLGVPGDGGTLSVTLAIRPDDAELRAALSDPAGFDHACRVLPGPDGFFVNGPLEPIGGVRPMGGLLNRLRRFTDDGGAPTVVGLHAVGDAHTCTNPLYGRGCSLALVQAVLLADAFRSHPGDALGRAEDYERGCRREVEPWFESSVQLDRLGADPAGVGGLAGGRPGEGAKGISALFVAAATDPVIGRGLTRFWNLLATPADLMADAELLSRMADVMADPDAYPRPPVAGPTREQLLAELRGRRGAAEDAGTIATQPATTARPA